jgi:hypothetical protein
MIERYRYRFRYKSSSYNTDGGEKGWKKEKKNDVDNDKLFLAT